MRNRNIIHHLFFMLMACLERRPWLYPRILANLRPQKWKNPFRTYMTGLTDGLKLRSQGRTAAWSAELVSSASYINLIRNGTKDQVLAWRNKFCTRIISRAHPSKLYCHVHDPALFPLVRALCAHYPRPLMKTIYGEPPMYSTSIVEYGRMFIGVKSRKFGV